MSLPINVIHTGWPGCSGRLHAGRQLQHDLGS